MEKIWTIIEILNWTTDYLAGKGFEHPRLNAELLLGHSLRLRRIELYLQYDRPLLPEELGRFKTALKKRLRYTPIQYITGETEFMSLPFVVSPSVCIPRPETETLVETVARRLKGDQSTLRVADIGTGSGNIAVSLARQIENVYIYAIDISPQALEIAKENAILNKVEKKIEFIQGDLLSPLGALSGGLDAVVSNPPYVKHGELDFLPKEVRDYEPIDGLDGGQDGLKFHRLIVWQAAPLLKKHALLALEVGDGQADQVCQIIEKIHSFRKVEKIEDLNRIERVVLAEKAPDGICYED